MKVNIEPTRVTPKITFNIDDRLLTLRGRSSPENAPVFYNSVYEIIQHCRLEKISKLTVIFMLEYFNTSSSRCIIDIFRNLQRMVKEGSEVEINWFYEEDDDDMLESGEDFADLVNLPISIIPIEEFPEIEEKPETAAA